MVQNYIHRFGKYVKRHWFGVGLGAGGVVAMAAVVVVIVGYHQQEEAKYNLSAQAAGLVGESKKLYADKLVYDAKTKKYQYNQGYQQTPTGTLGAGQGAAPKFTATLAPGEKPSVSVTDPASQLSMSIAPKFEVAEPRQDGNRLVYPLKGKNGSQVFSLRTGSLKEDIILNKNEGDSLTFEYELKLPSDLEARMNDDGSLGIYGAEPALLGEVSTGSEADAELLAKARQHSAKTSLIFTFPAPYVKDMKGINKAVTVTYSLSGSTLKVEAKGLNQATYPLTIDPSVYVESAVKFMAGNNETNIDFDTTNELIQKGTLTGSRFNNWTKTAAAQDLPGARWGHGTVVAGGYIYVIGGSSGSTNQTSVYWAKLDTTTYAITSPTPGSTGGACTQWCTNTAYDLPGARSGMAVAAYSGYLYAMGGFDAGGARTTTTYKAKVGANGEPISWATTAAFTTERSYGDAVAYSNKMYLLGGQSNAATGGVTGAGSIQYADINPNGTLGTWANTTVSMPSARWGHTSLQYNGYLYVIGGASGTTTQNTVQYSKLSSTGDVNASWTTTTAFTTARATLGGSIATIWGGYMYVSGGCTTVTATACTQFYNTGTASQSGTLITGTGTTWTSAMVGMVMTFANGITATVTGFNSATSLDADYDSQTVASQAYTLDLNDLAPQAASLNGDGTLTAWTKITLDGGQYYMTGTASQSGLDINGTGTTWNIDMVGRTLRFANGVSVLINGFESATILKGTVSQTVASQAYSLTQDVYYTTGTASQATTTITGVGTAWTTDMVGMKITFAGGATAIISAVNSATSLTTAGFSQTVGSSAYVIRANHPRSFSAGFVAWRNTLYTVGGCSVMSGANCSTPSNESEYGHINNDGDVSQRRNEATLPAAGNGTGQVGRMSQGVVINNGYIYSIGGCITVGCSGANTMSDNLGYAAIGADGTIVTNGVASCNGGGAATWCVDESALNTTVGLGAFGVTVYNNTIYVAGGNTGSAYQNRFFWIALAADGSPVGTWTDNGNVAGTTLAANYGYPFLFTRSASATTGNIFAVSGCTGAAGVGCTGYRTDVLKCTITNSTRAVSGCTTTGQLQLGTAVGIAAGAIHGNYLYLCGGADSTGAAQTDNCYYAELSSSNNVVRADTGLTTGGWQTATAQLPQIRRRGTGFAANGYMYVIGGHDGAAETTLHDVVYAKINQSTGDLTGSANPAVFDTSRTTITGRWNLGLAAANGFVYPVGGCTNGPPPGTCSAMSGVVESVQVHNNYSGSPAAYSTATNNMGVDYIGGQSTIYNGYIYYAGGCTNIGCTTYTNVVRYAPINADGNIGTWNTTNAMGTNRAFFGLTAHNGFMYAIGGLSATGTELATTEHAVINGAGTLNAWAGDTSMGAGNERADFGFAVFNGIVYVAGGVNNAGTAVNTVYHSVIGAGTLGAWTTTDTAFGTARSGTVLVAYGATLYLLGGFDGTNYLLDVKYVNIISGGTIGTWEDGPSLPQPVRQGAGYAANGYLYIFGGRSAATTCTTNTYVASINGYPPGSASRFGLGGWSQTIVAFSDARYGAAAAYNSGKAYLLGGGCAALVGTGTGTTANRVFYTSLQSQPQVANYSLAIDTDTDVFPAKWLMNGVDNGTGAQWQFNYRSSTNAAAVWGLNTNAGTVTLGTPGTYTPLDGGGGNTNLTVGARYYYLDVDVDASQAFGYPEDVTRGPTITDITLQFTADPGKRLHHGKTFTGGLLQPLDAPF